MLELKLWFIQVLTLVQLILFLCAKQVASFPPHKVIR